MVTYSVYGLCYSLVLYFYRNLLEESLQYDFNKIHWISSVLSPAYGAGIMAGNYRNINFSLTDIIKGVSN